MVLRRRQTIASLDVVKPLLLYSSAFSIEKERILDCLIHGSVVHFALTVATGSETQAERLCPIAHNASSVDSGGKSRNAEPKRGAFGPAPKHPSASIDYYRTAVSYRPSARRRSQHRLSVRLFSNAFAFRLVSAPSRKAKTDTRELISQSTEKKVHQTVIDFVVLLNSVVQNSC